MRSEQGLGADNAPGHKEHKAPGEEPVASASGISTVGVEVSLNNAAPITLRMTCVDDVR